MPCCLGIIQFQRCQHALLLKLGCTHGCTEFCPPEKQQTLVISKFLWLCEDCRERISNVELDERCNKWALKKERLQEQGQEAWIPTISMMEDMEQKLCEDKRVNAIEELQWVVEWTYEYGLMLYGVLIRKNWIPQVAAARIRQLRDLRPWDLMVVKDGLRDSKKLFEEQHNETYWSISDQLEEEWLRRRQLPRPPRRELPPVPLFPWTYDEFGRRSRASSSTLVCDDDGDVVVKDGKEEQAPTAQQPTPESSPPEVYSFAKEAANALGIWSEGTDDSDMDLS
ncbi:uncharacterized protein B0J16DRAFT_410933 [Fusarium flagelliforme]|uniref:Uncharacterized protein n=1 Tax=Fusarium flagelliforme TaxID=2675880 RepID=A0A395MPZ9_9HYPO|nr:uncharacterized protein B0J16DRAFT_410933 [Fusarium flagelliforme]KAH7192198.1 hypothetical protein B0J16DRAFT_410933 [Fusarium flagelliforme]RFN49493.1 hypothetical protein FIE12Z_6188 [Fusarium flagelliforme]